MEKKQFTFTGLNWMTPEQIQKVREQFSKLKDYGIEFEIVLRHDTRLFLYNYDDILESPNDDEAVTFVKKFKNETEESSDGKVYKLDEDCLLIFTIDDDMNIVAKLITYWGDIQEIQL